MYLSLFLQSNVSVKIEPLFGIEDATIFPPCRCIICLQRLRPIPLPCSLVVKNGMNILSITSGSIPGPLSETNIDTVPELDTNDSI